MLASSMRPFEGRDLPERLHQLLDRVLERIPGAKAFIADSDGLALVDRGGGADLIAILSSLTNHWLQLQESLSGNSAGEMAVQVAKGKVVHLLQEQTPWDRLILGVVVDTFLSRKNLVELRSWFSEAGKEEGA